MLESKTILITYCEEFVMLSIDFGSDAFPILLKEINKFYN